MYLIWVISWLVIGAIGYRLGYTAGRTKVAMMMLEKNLQNGNADWTEVKSEGSKSNRSN